MKKDVNKLRIIAYVDGYNLYYGLKDSNLQHLYWLNIKKLCTLLLKQSQKLVCVKYFTAKISAPEGKRKRQLNFLEALGTLTNFEIYYGQLISQMSTCVKCGHQWPKYEEKMTDVNMATEMLTDAFADNFDYALLISADSDLVPPVRTICSLFSHKKVIVAFPPGRASKNLGKSSNITMHLRKSLLKKSQFPDTVIKPGGYELKRPQKWK